MHQLQTLKIPPQGICLRQLKKLVTALTKIDNNFAGLTTIPDDMARGACCGLTFLLAEYIINGHHDDFFKIYKLICDTRPQLLARWIAENQDNPVFTNFIIKLYILYKKQTSFPVEEEDSLLEPMSMKWLRKRCSAGNHQRIGGLLLDTGTILAADMYERLTMVIEALEEARPVEIGLFNYSVTGAHSVLMYRYGEYYCLYEPSYGFICDKDPEVITRAIISSLNNLYPIKDFFDIYMEKYPVLFTTLLLIFVPISVVLLSVLLIKDYVRDWQHDSARKVLQDSSYLTYGKIEKTAPRIIEPLSPVAC